MQDVAIAMAGSRPSLSATSRAELDARYGKFMKAREGNKDAFSAESVKAKQEMSSKLRVAMG